MPENLFILLGPLPPPISGQTQAFKRLCSFFAERNLPYSIVDIGVHHSDRWAGHFSFVRGYEVLHSVWQFIRQLATFSKKTVYLPVAISPVGFVRDFLLIWLAKFAGCRLTLHLHGGGYADFYQHRPAWIRQVIRRTIIQADCVIVLSESLRCEFDFLGSLSPEIRAIPNCPGVDIQTQPRTESSVSAQPFRVLFLSNMLVSKGYWIAFEAVRRLVEKGYPIRIDFCGEFINDPDADLPDAEDNRHRFLEEIDSAAVRPWAAYHGVVYGEEKAARLRESDVLVLPTYYRYEGQPIAIIEAFANGKPVIGTRYRGIQDMVIDGGNGFLITPVVCELEDALEKLLNSPQLQTQMNEAAFDTFRRKFSPDVVGERLVAAICGYADPAFIQQNRLNDPSISGYRNVLL